MFAQQRKALILDLLRQNGSVSLNELMDTFGVSEATVRRDLTELERANLLRRTHGGAVSGELSVYEEDYAKKESEYLEEKQSIARMCAELVNDGDTVLLDSGTTTFEIARLLRMKQITLITNSPSIISDVMNAPDCRMELICIGGRLRSNFRSIVGGEAEDFVRRMIPDKVFVAANGFSLEHGATTPAMSEASIKRAMVSVGKQVYLAVDSSKIGKDYLSVIAAAGRFDGIITDVGIDAVTFRKLREMGVPVITEHDSTILRSKGVGNMEISEIFKPENITLQLHGKTREEVIPELMEMLFRSGAISDQEEMVKAAMKREQEFSTGIGFAVAIPHAKSAYVNRTAIAFGRSSGVEWPTEDGVNPKMIFLIVVPLEARNRHLQLLAQISRKIVHEEVREKILNAKDANSVIDALG